MAETSVANRCTTCGALLDEEDLFCANCGTEAPGGSATPSEHPRLAGEGTLEATHNFTCENCGASMSYDASAQTLRCPFCGSEKLHAERDVKVLSPEAVVPFATSRNDAQAALQRFMGSSFWRPGDLATVSVLTKITPVYVPYWVFSATVYTYWCADTSQTPRGASASWFPISGERSAQFNDVIVGASGTLTPAETDQLCPFDVLRAVPPREIDLTNVVYEPFRVQKKYARPQAIHGFEERERQECRKLVPLNARNVHVAIRLEDLASKPVLLPVWIMAYQYRGQNYRFLVNGQSGRHTGQAPFSYAKAAMVGVASVVAIVAVAIIFLICAGLMTR